MSSVGGGANPAVSVASATDPASISPQTAQARLALLDQFVYDVPATDAGLVQDKQQTVYPFPQGNYGYGNGLNYRPTVRIDFSGRAPVVREMKLSFTLRTLYPPGGVAIIPTTQSYYAMRYSLVDSVMQLDEHIHDIFSQIIIQHPSGQEIYREREVGLVSRLLRIANAPTPPARWALYPQPLVGGWAGLGPFTGMYDNVELQAADAAQPYQLRSPSAMRLQRMPIDPVGEEVYEGMNVNAWVDGMRSMFFSAFQPLPGPAGQEASSAVRGRQFKIRLPARCFDGAPIWPAVLQGLIISLEFSPPGQCFKPTTPRMSHELGCPPDDFVFMPALPMPTTTGTEWGYQMNDLQIELPTLRLSATMNEAINTAAESAGLPISWTQVADSIAPVPAGATNLITTIPLQVSNLVGVMVATYSQANRQDWRQRLYLMNVWNTFAARLGTASIPPGAPYTGPVAARELLRGWFPLPRGARGYITPVDWEGSQELVIRCQYRYDNITPFNSVMATISRFNPRNFVWALDLRTTPGVPLTGVSTLNSQLSLMFTRASANIPTTLAVQLGASATTGQAATTYGTLPSLTVPTAAITVHNLHRNEVFIANKAKPYIIAPRGYEAVQALNNYYGDFVYPIVAGHASLASSTLSNYQNEVSRNLFLLAAGTSVDDNANKVSIVLATGRLTQYVSGADHVPTTGSNNYMVAHPGASTDLVNHTFGFYTRLVFFGTAGITTRE